MKEQKLQCIVINITLGGLIWIRAKLKLFVFLMIWELIQESFILFRINDLLKIELTFLRCEKGFVYDKRDERLLVFEG